MKNRALIPLPYSKFYVLSESVMKKGVFTSKFSYICPKSCLGQKWSFFWTKMPITP